jgi:hypothetical protein
LWIIPYWTEVLKLRTTSQKAWVKAEEFLWKRKRVCVRGSPRPWYPTHQLLSQKHHNQQMVICCGLRYIYLYIWYSVSSCGCGWWHSTSFSRPTPVKVALASHWRICCRCPLTVWKKSVSGQSADKVMQQAYDVLLYLPWCHESDVPTLSFLCFTNQLRLFRLRTLNRTRTNPFIVQIP